jgi:hypothetical protein
VKRLQERKGALEAQLDKLKAYVVRIMDDAGVKKLEGNSVTFSLRKNPASVAGPMTLTMVKPYCRK